MICQRGRCLKCGKPYFINGRPTADYNELLIKLAGGGFLTVGLCGDCTLAESEFDEARDIVNESLKINGGSPVGKWIEIESRKTMPEITLEIQGNRCPVCHEPIGDNWVYTQGEIRHEGNCLKAKHKKEGKDVLEKHKGPRD